MKHFFLFAAILLEYISAGSQTLISSQYASSVIAYSTQYSSTSYGAIQALGKPNVYPYCGDNPLAWESATQNGGREFLVLGYSTLQPVNTVKIFQGVSPGAIDTVYLRNASSGDWNTIYVATAVSNIQCPGFEKMMLEIQILTTTYNVDAIRIALNSPAVAYYNSIDAVSIANLDIMPLTWREFAATVIAVSSEYNPPPGSWNSTGATGAPNVAYCSDNGYSWASLTGDDQREYIALRYAYPAKCNGLRIFQSYNPGAIDTVYLRDAVTGTWHTIYSATAAALPCEQSLLDLNFTRTTYIVDAVRIALNSPAVPSYNEIDAVELTTDLPAAAVRSAKTGNWKDTATWVGGNIPKYTDLVVIGAGHIIALDTTGDCAGMYMTFSSTLNLNQNKPLKIGTPGGGRSQMLSFGAVNMSSGELVVDGNIKFNEVSSFNMTGGLLLEDGNTETVNASVRNGTNLVEFSGSMNSFNFSGGTLQIVDPPFGANSQCLKCGFNFGTNTTLKFGDGASTAAGGYAYGFGGSLLPGQIGHFVLDAVTDIGNRFFLNTNAFLIKKGVDVESGNLIENSLLTVQ